MSNIRVVLVDDHEVVRTGLKTFLETQDDIDVIGEASNGLDAVTITLAMRPDVVVMDISMPEIDGMEATRRLTDQCPNCHVLALTVHKDKQYLFEMLRAGATGYITKQAAADELVSAIRAVSLGNVYLQPTLARFLLDDYQRLESQAARNDINSPSDDASLDVLSKRERQVLELVAEGLTSPQIGKSLGISPKTVSRHRERIMNKLNLHSSAALVKFAIRTGLIGLND
jgi:two-component system response regulator NreC